MMGERSSFRLSNFSKANSMVRKLSHNILPKNLINVHLLRHPVDDVRGLRVVDLPLRLSSNANAADLLRVLESGTNYGIGRGSRRRNRLVGHRTIRIGRHLALVRSGQPVARVRRHIVLEGHAALGCRCFILERHPVRR